MKIIEDARAPNPRRVRIFLAEKGIEVPREALDIMARDHYSDAFTALNPYRRVPVLVLEDGTAIAETVAICRYFEALQPEPCLFGRTPKEQGRVEMWNRRAEHGLFFHVAQTLRHGNPRMADLEVPQVPEWGEANRAKIEGALEELDRALASTRYLAGDDFSIADITAMVAFDFMRVIKATCPERLVNIKRWHEVVSARPSATA